MDNDRLELDQLYSVTYEELRRLASVVRRGDPSATLNPTALVNEAWMKLARTPEVAHLSRQHFKRVAAKAMRELLVEAARRRNARKRGDGAVFVTLDESASLAARDERQMLALDDAMKELERMNSRQAQVVEYRFFGGLEADEIASVLDVSEKTVLRDWRAARAWLADQLRYEH